MRFTLRYLRRKEVQPLWRLLHRMSLIGLNYWSSEFDVTGERQALAFVASRLGSTNRPVVFDVGANVGDYSRACLRAFRQGCDLHAFEPASSTFDHLTSDPELSAQRVSLHRIAFSDREGEATLHTSEAGSSIASLEPLERPVRPFDESLDEQVRVCRIDRFCEEQGIDRIDFLKLDIEGHELSALRGAGKMLADRRVRFLQFEFGENNVSSRTFLADFDKLLGDQFQLYRIVPGGLVPWRYEGGRSEIFATMNYLCELRAD